MSWLRNSTPAFAVTSTDPDEGDASLVTQATRGDAQAFALLYRRYLNQVYAFAASRLDSRETAEDVTQTIFLKALGSLHTCRQPELFAGWLFAIARNVVIDAQRTNRVVITTIDDRSELADTARSPESEAIASEWSRELERLRRDCLSAGDRELLDLRMQGLSDKEIAIALQRSHGAVRTAQYRMVKRLRGCLDRIRGGMS
ncbi:MAG: sigma-70 family RNA polymerase sigma factor [Thermomicrobiales bacterium]|nr:sigma-70 family RNA polymerase sigma factor [Thermomicrobiales bacterium]